MNIPVPCPAQCTSERPKAVSTSPPRSRMQCLVYSPSSRDARSAKRKTCGAWMSPQAAQEAHRGSIWRVESAALALSSDSVPSIERLCPTLDSGHRLDVLRCSEGASRSPAVWGAVALHPLRPKPINATLFTWHASLLSSSPHHPSTPYSKPHYLSASASNHSLSA